MERLFKLINGLKPVEIQNIKDFYLAKFQNSNQSDNKRLQLFTLVAEGKVTNNDEAALALYHKKCNSALSHLKKRVEEDILNFLLVDFSDSGLPKDTREELQCNKMLLQGKMLMAKGIWEEGISLLEKTFQLSERYEFPDLKLASYDILRTYSSKNVDMKTHATYNQLMDKCLEDYQKLLKAKSLSFMFSEPTAAVKPAQLLPATRKINDDESKKVVFWNKMALCQFYKNQHDFKNAKKYAYELLEDLQVEPKIYSEFKMAQVSLELAEILIYSEDYQQAIQFSENAIEIFPYSSVEYLQSLQVYFFANFRSGKIGQAENVVELALKHPLVNGKLQNRWILHQAAIMFVQKNFPLVNKLLHTNKTAKRDADNEVSSRILEVLNILEIEDFDWFEFRIETFRKKIQTLKDKSYERLRIFYSILKTLVRCNYNYQKILSLESKNLSLLCGKKPFLSWNPMGYELINTYDWIVKKAQ